MIDHIVSLPAPPTDYDRHQAVWKLVGGKARRDFLFVWAGSTLVVRCDRPIPTIGPDRPQYREIAPPRAGDEFAFAVRMHACGRTRGRQERPVPDADLCGWFAQRIHGFDVLSLTTRREPGVAVGLGKGWAYPAWFRGTLLCTNPAAAQASLRDGIGRMRGFGFGLILATPS